MSRVCPPIFVHNEEVFSKVEDKPRLPAEQPRFTKNLHKRIHIISKMSYNELVR